MKQIFIPILFIAFCQSVYASKASTIKDAIVALKKEIAGFKSDLSLAEKQAKADFEAGKPAQKPRTWQEPAAYQRIGRLGFRENLPVPKPTSRAGHEAREFLDYMKLSASYKVNRPRTISGVKLFGYANYSASDTVKVLNPKHSVYKSIVRGKNLANLSELTHYATKSYNKVGRTQGEMFSYERDAITSVLKDYEKARGGMVKALDAPQKQGEFLSIASDIYSTVYQSRALGQRSISQTMRTLDWYQERLNYIQKQNPDLFARFQKDSDAFANLFNGLNNKSTTRWDEMSGMRVYDGQSRPVGWDVEGNEIPLSSQ